MSEITERAARARRLRGDDAFQEFMEAVRQRQLARFMNLSGTPEDREDAHAILRALAEIEGTLDAAIGDETIEQKRKGQHRGHD